MKRVTDTLGLARSNIAERVKGVRPKRGPQTRDGDLELACQCRLNFPHLCRSKIPQFFDQPAG
jgi:hypothetical protein